MAMFQKSEEAKRGPNAEEIKKATSSVQRFEKPASCSSTLATAIDVCYFMYMCGMSPFKRKNGIVKSVGLYLNVSDL